MTDGKRRTHTPTMTEIARRAGVSRATVSIILASPGLNTTRFKPETVARVRQVAEEMGYQANLMALSLKTAHPFFFGLVLRGTGEEGAVSWHHQAFEGQFQAGVMEASQVCRLFPVLATQDSPRLAEALERVRKVLDGGVFGAVLRTPRSALVEVVRRRIERGFPAVIVFPDDPGMFPANAIDMDNLAGGQVAGKLLHEAGRSRWCLIRDDLPREALRLREEGFVSVAREVGARVEILELPFGAHEGRMVGQLAPVLRDLRPDGVYAASSAAGVGAMLACDAAGLRMPEDTCLVGCDASLWRPPGFPPITSVDVSWFSTGVVAVRKMVELREREMPLFENVMLPPVVRKGGTCLGGDREPPDVCHEAP